MDSIEYEGKKLVKQTSVHRKNKKCRENHKVEKGRQCIVYRRHVTSQPSMNSLTINKGCKGVAEMYIPITLEIRKKGSEAFANEDHPQLSNTVELLETILKKIITNSVKYVAVH